jgi:ubiquitin C-terminal hydrolase
MANHTAGKESKPKGSCVACALQRLAHAYWAGWQPKHINQCLQGFHQAVNSVRGSGAWYFPDPDEQCDVSEFWTWLLTTLTTQHGRYDTPGLQHLFNIRLEATWRCKCGHKHTTFIEEPALTVGITHPAPGLTLDAYLDALTREHVDVTCDSPACRSTQERQRRLALTRAPDTLFVGLKRFKWQRGRMAKINSRVDFPATLHLGRLAKSSGADPANRGLEYELGAYIAHAGGAMSGHYICMVRGQEGIAQIDDLSVERKGDWRAVKKGFTPYLLVYHRKSRV